MAYRVPNSNTTLTSAVGWDTVTNTPTLHATTTITATGSIFSGTFTAPNLVNKVTGVLVMVNSTGNWSSGDLTMTATLQESTVDTAATATVTLRTTSSTAYTLGSWVYFRFATPYTFTTLTAGAYRFKITRGTATASPNLKADSGGLNFAYMATIDQTGALGSTDDLLVLGHNFSTTPLTVTWDGTQSIGSGLGALTTQTTSQTLSTGLYVGAYGIINADTTANVTTTCKGHVIQSLLGEFNVGTSGTPYPTGKKFTWTFNTTTSGDYGWRVFGGTFKTYGLPKSSTTLWKTTFSSGLGTSASPLITADAVDWTVGDQILVLASSNNATNYNEFEYRYIITKNSSTSYVLSSTFGGAENALVNTHTNAYILNLERNIIFQSNNTARGWYFHVTGTNVSNAPTNGAIETQWTRYEQTGVSGSDPLQGWQLGGAQSFVLDYCVFYDAVYCGWWGSNSTSTQTLTGNIFVIGSGSQAGIYGQNLSNKTCNDFFFVDYSGQALTPYGASNTFNRAVFNSCRKSGSISTNSAAMLLQLVNNTVFNDCEWNCCGTGITWATATDVVFNNCSFGTKGYNVFDISGAASYNTAIFNSCPFSSPTRWSGVSTSDQRQFYAGSEIRFDRLNDTDNVHEWRTNYGIAQSTGTGLSDTLVRTPGSLNVRIEPQDSTTGFTWTFLIPASTNTNVSFSGYFLKNVAMGTDVCTVSLYLPGLVVGVDTPSATTTLSNNVSNTWTGSAVQAVALSAYYTGATDRFATVVVNAKSTTAGAYLYCADFYNSGDTVTLLDKLAGLTIWYNAKPSPIITPLNLGGIAPAVWAVGTAGLTTSGTTGNNMKKVLTTPKFIGLK